MKATEQLGVYVLAKEAGLVKDANALKMLIQQLAIANRGGALGLRNLQRHATNMSVSSNPLKKLLSGPMGAADKALNKLHPPANMVDDIAKKGPLRMGKGPAITDKDLNITTKKL